MPVRSPLIGLAVVASAFMAGGCSRPPQSASSGDRVESVSSSVAAVDPEHDVPPATAPRPDAERPFMLDGSAGTLPPPAVAPAVDRVVNGFLSRYWSPTPMTYAELAVALEPYATDRLRSGWFDPTVAGETVPRSAAGPVDRVRIVRSETLPDRTVVTVAAAVSDAASGTRVLHRTLEVVSASGTWKVDAVR